VSPRHLAVLASVVLAAGCGVEPQAAPEDLTLSPIPPATSGVPGGDAGQQLVLWFLRDDALAPVERSAAAADAATALALLAEGPTAQEADAGLTTAISRQPLTVAANDDAAEADVLTVQVTEAFTGVAGADQLRAVAQVVWTVTEPDDVDAVRFTTDVGGPLEVPTDAGLTDAPVDREDYASLAPDDPVAVD
jgi:spore germination protein GerM